MKEVYVLRHGEKDADGNLHERGKRAAEAMRPVLPTFIHVYSSPVERAAQTAFALTGTAPETDERAAFAMAPAEVSNAINALVHEQGISFLDAARQYNDTTVLEGVDSKARELNLLIDELLDVLPEDGKALVVSHDLTIVPAMALRGTSPESIEPLGGYIVSHDGEEITARNFSQMAVDDSF